MQVDEQQDWAAPGVVQNESTLLGQQYQAREQDLQQNPACAGVLDHFDEHYPCSATDLRCCPVQRRLPGGL